MGGRYALPTLPRTVDGHTNERYAWDSFGIWMALPALRDND